LSTYLEQKRKVLFSFFSAVGKCFAAFYCRQNKKTAPQDYGIGLFVLSYIYGREKALFKHWD